MQFFNRPKTRNFALALCALWMLLAGALSPARAQTIAPLDKDGSLFVVQQPANGSSSIYKVNRATSPYTLTAYTGTAPGATVLNALGYNRVDGYMYVLAAPTSATIGLYRVGKTSATTGDFNSLGAISGLPNATYYAGSVSLDGYFYISNAATASSSTMYRINLNAGAPYTATAITLSSAIQVGDVAFGSNGKLYSVSLNGSQFYEIGVSSTSTTATVTARATTGAPSGLTIGSLFFDGARQLYAYSNNGAFYTIDIPSATFASVSTASSVSQSDGAGISDTPEYVDVIKSVGAPTQINARTFDVPYVVGVKNTTNVTAPNVQVNDKLRNTFSDGNPTISIVSKPVLTVTEATGITPTLNQSFNGDSDTRLFSGTDDYPPNAVVRVAFTARVTYPTVASVPDAPQLNSAYVSSVAGTTYTNPGYTFSGTTAIPPVNAVAGEVSSPGTTFPATKAGDTPGGTGVTLPPTALSGRVYEDYNFGGGAGRAYNASQGMAGAPGARVEIYNASGTFVGATLSESDGTWSYAVSATGTYYARVVNSSVLSTRAGSSAALVGVQTFRTNNGTAVTGEVGGRAPQSVGAGAGDAGTTLNTTTFQLSGSTTGPAQSVTPIVVTNSTDRSGFDFGFNFDTVVNTNDAGQGSLRQFVLNSNALGNNNLAQVGQTAGQEVSIFQIPATDSRYSANGPARILLASPLDAIAGANAAQTVIDGATQTANVGNTNTANLGVSSGVGTGTRTVSPLAGPEIEISGNGNLTQLLTIGAASNVAIKNLALTGQNGAGAGNNNQAAVVINGATNPTVTANVFGATTTTTGAPAAATRVSDGVIFGATTSANAAITNNVFSQLGHRAIVAGAPGTTQTINGLTIEGNQILTTGSQMNSDQSDGDGIVLSGAYQNAVVRGNLFDGVASGSGAFGDNAIEVYFNVSGSASGGLTIEENTIRNGRGVGVSLADTNAGGSSFNAGTNSSGKTISVARNLIQNVASVGTLGGSGVEVRGAQNARISQNSFYGNGALAIDLGAAFGAGPGKGVSANDGAKSFGADNGNGGMDYPIFTRVQQTGSDVRVSGYIGNVATGSATWADAPIEFYFADNAPANQNGEVIAGDGKSVAHGEGRTFLTGGAANSNGTFDITLSGVTLGSNQITAIAMDANGNTSEFSANSGALVPPLVNPVAGRVYLDQNRNGSFDNNEDGLGLNDLFVKAILNGQTSAAQAVAVNATTGNYTIDGLAAGTYTLILDDNANLNDTTAAIPPGYVSTQSPGGTRTVTVTDQAVLNQNFGLFNGAQISGNVYEDTGNGSGPGIPNVKVNLTKNDGTVVDTATTDASGNFSFKVPSSLASTPLKVVEFNADNYRSASGNAGNTGGTYDLPTDTISFAYTAGSTYSGLKFGDARGISFTGEDAKTGTIGSSVFYPHVFTSQTAGSVSFSTTQTTSPNNSAWTVVQFQDSNGNGTLDGGDAQITGPLSVTAGKPITIFLQNFIPTTASNGAQDKLTVTANFTPTTGAAQSISRSDLTTVAANQGLVLTKTVDKATAQSGDVLLYTITYRNTGADALTNLVINDATPAYTRFVSAADGTRPAGLTGVTIASPGANNKGAVSWTFAGSLNPSQSGTVTFRVRVE